MISHESLAHFVAHDAAHPAADAIQNAFDLEGYLVTHGFDVIRRKPWQSHPGGLIYEIATCPFCPDHVRGSAAFTLENGKPGFRCQHSGCQGKTIKDVFAQYPSIQTAPPHAATARTEARPKAAPSVPALLDGYLVYKTDYPAPVFLFNGLLANGLTVVAGRPKSGKSWLTLQMAVDAAMQRPFLDRFEIEQPVNVLYCGLEEGPQRTHNRLRKLLTKNDIQLQNIDFRYSLKPLAEGGAAELDVLLGNKSYGLVVIDTFLRIAKATGGNTNVMRSEYGEITQLQELAQRHKLAMVLVHHTRKMAAESGLDTVAGTTGITAACDAVWTLRKLPGGESILEVTGREMEEQTLGMRLTDDYGFGWHLTGEGAEVGMSEARQEIVDLLKDEAPLTPKQVALSLRKNAVTIRRLLQKMLADGVVEKGRDGKYFLAPREQRERVNAVNRVSSDLKVVAVGGKWVHDSPGESVPDDKVAE